MKNANGSNGTNGTDGEEIRSRLQRRREERYKARGDVWVHADDGHEYLYRPGEVLVARADEERVAPLLEDNGLVRDRSAIGENLDVVRWQGPADLDVPGILERIRSSVDGSPPAVAPNTVFVGEPVYYGGPGSEPSPAGPLPEPAEPSAGKGVLVAVLDTGIDAGAATDPLLRDHFDVDPGDIDALNVDGDSFLDLQAGHGTFVAGIIVHNAAGARFDPEAVLDPDGIGDDFSLAAGLADLRRDVAVLNLSLGGYTEDDLAPLALRALLATEQLRDVVVVAAAGNNGSTRPFWPAALKSVVAVGAVDGGSAPARFSNRGHWVDACARGVDVHSTYVDAFPWPSVEGAEVSFERFATWSGTSFAAPFVAARIARAMSVHGVDGREAARLVVHDPALPQVRGLGALVV